MNSAVEGLGNNNVAVLSDVHIGSSAPTCWYQRAIHEPYLTAALNWIAQNAAHFQELVLLGDLVDTWTYPPSTRPPSMAEIIAGNPNVLGPEGALAKVVKAVPKVTYLLGNHDGTLTQAEIATLQNSVGPVQLVGGTHVLTGASDSRTVFSHGHLWTMFNAPDEHSPWDMLPVGHFVTRAFSYMMANQLKPGENVAERSNMGYPNGIDIYKFLLSLGRELNPDVADMLLNYVIEQAEMPEATPIVLPNGAKTTIVEAKKIYADLFTRWEKEEGSTLTAARAGMADGSGEYLAWFAQRLAIEQSADLVVFGHTHQPVGGLAVSPVDYYNSGFECASAPDNPPKLFTFTVVDLDTPSAQIMMVEHGSYVISSAPVQAMPSVVLSPFLDYSCYVRILNRTSQPLDLTEAKASEGSWVVPPTQAIAPGGRGDGWLQDRPGLYGSAGTFSYTKGGTKLSFSVACPYKFWPNSASGPGNDFIARSGSGAWGSRGSVPKWGYPLQVIFTVE